MTKNDTWELLEYATTAVLADHCPELDRQTIRSNVRVSLETLRNGLYQAYVCGMTGELTEATNVYEVRVP